MPVILDEDSATLEINTPEVIYTSGANKHYSGWINFGNMQSGDVTTLRIGVKVLEGDNFTTFFEQTFSGANGGQGSPVFMVPFIPASYGVEFELEQTDGTGRLYSWQIVEP